MPKSLVKVLVQEYTFKIMIFRPTVSLRNTFFKNSFWDHLQVVNRPHSEQH